MADWPNIDAHLDGEEIPHGEPTVAQTTGGQHAPGSLHYAGRARDYGNLDTPGGNDGCDRIYFDLEPFAQSGVLQELFWNPRGCWQKGRRIGPVDGHWDHVHAGLALGQSLPVKPKREPRRLFNEEQEFLLYG